MAPVIVIIVIAIALALAASSPWVRTLSKAARRSVSPYRRAAAMTANELDFHQTLKAACAPDGREAWPQVAMTALIQPKINPKTSGYWAVWNKISTRRVDWVVAEHGEPRLIVELDDRTHDAAADHDRDEILNACGYPVLRVQSRAKPTPRLLRDQINDKLTAPL
jgi:hypothetical protein